MSRDELSYTNSVDLGGENDRASKYVSGDKWGAEKRPKWSGGVKEERRDREGETPIVEHDVRVNFTAFSCFRILGPRLCFIQE